MDPEPAVLLGRSRDGFCMNVPPGVLGVTLPGLTRGDKSETYLRSIFNNSEGAAIFVHAEMIDPDCADPRLREGGIL